MRPHCLLTSFVFWYIMISVAQASGAERLLHVKLLGNRQDDNPYVLSQPTEKEDALELIVGVPIKDMHKVNLLVAGYCQQRDELFMPYLPTDLVKIIVNYYYISPKSTNTIDKKLCVWCCKPSCVIAICCCCLCLLTMGGITAGILISPTFWGRAVYPSGAD